MGLKADLIERDDRAWDEFRSLIDVLSDDKIQEPGYSPEWSVKDLLAHMGCWMAESAQVLVQVRAGTFRGWQGDIDAKNREFYDSWRDVDLDAVRAHLHAARARMLDEWDRLHEERVPGPAEQWFREGGPDHYAEHLPELREWVAKLQDR